MGFLGGLFGGNNGHGMFAEGDSLLFFFLLLIVLFCNCGMFDEDGDSLLFFFLLLVVLFCNCGGEEAC
jgi:hypothetical protein